MAGARAWPERGRGQCEGMAGPAAVRQLVSTRVGARASAAWPVRGRGRWAWPVGVAGGGCGAARRGHGRCVAAARAWPVGVAGGRWAWPVAVAMGAQMFEMLLDYVQEAGVTTEAMS